ncbi:MAG TPA: tRNA-guanine transglycosylase, partial [bacterium]
MKRPEWEDGFQFEIIAHDSKKRARTGRLVTPHGTINTPAFMPVGTYGAVKGISPDELRAAGAEIVLSNALHLDFRPGAESVQKLGGLHRLMGWDGPILTDSGGFQSFSLASLTKRRDDGLE